MTDALRPAGTRVTDVRLGVAGTVTGDAPTHDGGRVVVRWDSGTVGEPCVVDLATDMPGAARWRFAR